MTQGYSIVWKKFVEALPRNKSKQDKYKCGHPTIRLPIYTHSVDDASAKRGYRLVGDVDYKGVTEVEGVKITPVPGGVGPMTIAMLLKNTVNSCVRSQATK